MKSRLLAIAGALGFALSASATIPLWTNYTSLSFPPQVDATAFLNAGIFNLTTELPFDTQNTRFYTNKGTMLGTPGYRFDYVSTQETNSGRFPTDTFKNEGTITAADNGTSYYGIGGYAVGGIPGSYVLINSTNVLNVNGAYLGAGEAGIIKIDGKNVDLSYGRLRTGVDPYYSSGSLGGTVSGTGLSGYINPPGVLDRYWALGTNQVMQDIGDAPPLPLTGNPAWYAQPFPRAPRHAVTGSTYVGVGSGSVPVSTNNRDVPLIGVYTNIVNPTNHVYHFVVAYKPVVNTNLPSPIAVNTTVRFPVGGGQGVVGYVISVYDPVLNQMVSNSVFLTDSSPSTRVTNRVLLANALEPTYRPSIYSISRSAPAGYYSALSYTNGNTFYNPALIYRVQMTNNAVTNIYAAYSASIGQGQDNTITIYDPEFGGSFESSPYYYYGYSNTAIGDPTNSVGRIEINAENVNLNNARMRSESLLTLRTKNLQNTYGFIGDCKLWSLDLATPTPTLTISNLVPSTVQRLEGSVFAWTGIWTNYLNSREPPPGTNETVVNITYYYTIVDATLTPIQQTEVLDLKMTATNSIIYDRMNVQRGLYVDAQNLTLRTNFSMGYGLTNWCVDYFPNVVNLTNMGDLSVADQGYFGTDRAEPYHNLVNQGYIQGSALFFRANNLEVADPVSFYSVLSSSVGPVDVTAGNVRLSDGFLSAGTDVILRAENLALDGFWYLSAGYSYYYYYANYSLGRVILDITNSIVDSAYSGNISVNDGIQLLRRPATGDLFSASVSLDAIDFREMTSVWAAEDRGRQGSAGFTNNAVLGQLTMDGTGFNSRFHFTGTGTQNAMYVENLRVLVPASEVESRITVDTNLVIYYAMASGSDNTSESLDGAAGGRIRWAKDFAGPNSSTPILVWNGASNVVMMVNTAKLTSDVLDSDADGEVNSADLTPFDGVKTKVSISGSTATVSWTAAADTLYTVQYKDSLSQPTWNLLRTILSGTTNGPLSVTDTLSGSATRYYRVTYTP